MHEFVGGEHDPKQQILGSAWTDAYGKKLCTWILENNQDVLARLGQETVQMLIGQVPLVARTKDKAVKTVTRFIRVAREIGLASGSMPISDRFYSVILREGEDAVFDAEDLPLDSV